MTNCLIIENDKKEIEKISALENEFIDINFTYTTEVEETALNLILKNNFNLIFFNMDSNKFNIPEFLLDVKNSYNSKLNFIGLSSKKESAYKAYNYDFCDFILKPLNELSIRKCILKFKKKQTVHINKTICLKSNKDYRYLCIDDILFLKADNNTTDFHMSDGTIIGAYKTLKTFEECLPTNFLRIHKSYIINSNFISRIHYGKSMCTLSNNQYKLPFTKTFKYNIDIINDLYYKNVITSN
ncbi:LytTR family DNA-binding domain-containing protein [Polaribacter sp. Hel_I_88]|uniref:LytR/AlgR family response regulator transcription factor n=1 Tax=Polaribacter sp. Hel_I_88 TaxID=1250006 RepID=UPI00047DE12B|nr:LytTR family DNA-binding domain-containing protein [Polaribacter sp. Hel_I_88]